MKRCLPAQFRPAAIVTMTMTMTLAWPALSTSQAPAPNSGSAPDKPVLVELFTSEGCSDCPPADDLLSRLDREQPIPGVRVVVLSEHVTYWNHAGWRDPFSLDQMDQRQNDYVARFHIESSYTPQAVVDGAEQLVGNSPRKVVDAIVHQASQPAKPLEITMAVLEKGSTRFSVQAPDSQGEHLYAALAQDVTRSEVTRGENAGRTLHHVAVVRTLKQFKSNFADGRELGLPAGNLDTSSGAGALRLVVFLEDPHSGRIVSAAEKSLSPTH